MNEEELKALKDLADANDLSAERVVENSRPAAHPLHHRFEWNDKVAGHEHRLDQARELIRSVKVVFNTTTINIKTVAYVHRPDEPKQQGYVPTAILQTDEERGRLAIDAEAARVAGNLERMMKLAVVWDQLAYARQHVAGMMRGVLD